VINKFRVLLWTATEAANWFVVFLVADFNRRWRFNHHPPAGASASLSKFDDIRANAKRASAAFAALLWTQEIQSVFNAAHLQANGKQAGDFAPPTPRIVADGAFSPTQDG